MRNRYRELSWAVAAVHLLAAGATWYAGVAAASPIVLALAALVAFGLGCSRSAGVSEERPGPLGRAEATGHLVDVESEPGRPDVR